MEQNELIREIVRKVVLRLENERKIEPSDHSPDFGLSISIDEAARKCRISQLEWIKLTLEKRKLIVAKLRDRLRSEAERLSRMAVDETGFGRYDDKIAKNHLVIDKTPGIEFLHPEAFSGDHGLTIIERAPYGIIGAITPCTNPSETIINNAIGMISGGNGVIFNAHPSAKGVSAFTIGLFNRTIVEHGGPAHLIGSVVDPTIETAGQLMAHPDVRLLVVTGGPAVVSAAMNSGKKVIAAGPGNPPVVVDETADILLAAKGLVKGASLDNNIVCIAEKEIFVVASVADDLKFQMTRNGAYELPTDQIPALEKLVIEDGYPAKRFIGKDAAYILNSLGIKVANDIRIVLVETDNSHPFVRKEMMMPVLPLVRVRNVDEGIRLAKEVEHGCRHTAGMYSRNIEALDKMAKVMDCSIFVKNAPHYAGLGLDGEGYTSFTIASPTGEGLTTVRDFTRVRRCTLANYFRIV